MSTGRQAHIESRARKALIAEFAPDLHQCLIDLLHAANPRPGTYSTNTEEQCRRARELLKDTGYTVS